LRSPQKIAIHIGISFDGVLSQLVALKSGVASPERPGTYTSIPSLGSIVRNRNAFDNTATSTATTA
jgi:hypothetical protein